MRRTFLTRLAFAAALATAGPALAQDPTGYWHTPAGDSLSIKTQTSIDPTTQVATPRGLLQLRYASGSWAVCAGTELEGRS